MHACASPLFRLSAHPCRLPLTTPSQTLAPPPPWRQSLDLLSFLGGWLIPPLFVRYFHASALVFQFMYLWSKQNPEAQVRVVVVVVVV